MLFSAFRNHSSYWEQPSSCQLLLQQDLLSAYYVRKIPEALLGRKEGQQMSLKIFNKRNIFACKVMCLKTKY